MRFAILPDRPISDVRVMAAGSQVLRHASGRPWIIGDWTDEDLVVASVGDRQVALLGRTTMSNQVLEKHVRGIRTNADLTQLAGEAPGCFHLVSSLGGQVRAQGSLAGVYRIYYGTVDGVAVAADRPDWLVGWKAASLDQDLLPLWQLLPYGPPWPLNLRCLWRGVDVVLPGRYLEIDRSGVSRTAPWWSPPEARMSREEGAARVRAALEESVLARAGSSGTVPLSFDLSGGIDSTSLCYLAARLGIPLRTLHLAFSDRSNPDSRWAELAQRDIDAVDHITLPTRLLPGYFVDEVTSGSEVVLEGPTTLVLRGVIEHTATVVASAGATRHLQGHGADELFAPGPAVLSTLLSGHPWRRFRMLRAIRSRQRLTFAGARDRLRSPRSYRDWLLQVADDLDTGRDRGRTNGWEIAPRSPEWASPEAVSQARRLIRTTAEESAEPLVPNPVGHALLRGIQVGGQMIRQSSMIGERVGVSFEGPYLDDRVVEAVLSTRLEERFQARVNKPMLATAMRGVVPAELLSRHDKSNGDRELFDGIRRSRRTLEQVLADPLLARLGLANADVLRSTVLGLQPEVDRLLQLAPTWACEMWLRAITAATSPTLDRPVSAGRSAN